MDGGMGRKEVGGREVGGREMEGEMESGREGRDGREGGNNSGFTSLLPFPPNTCTCHQHLLDDNEQKYQSNFYLQALSAKGLPPRGRMGK